MHVAQTKSCTGDYGIIGRSGFRRAFVVAAIPILMLLVLQGRNSAQGTTAGDPFDSYSHRISKKKERFLLDNFAIFLTRNPEMIGYVAYYEGARTSPGQARLRAERAVKYLSGVRRINPGRIVIIYGGELDRARTVLQPVPRNSPPPDFGVPKDEP